MANLLPRSPVFRHPAALALALVFAGVTPCAAQTLTCGTVVNGSIDSAAELDVFTFAAEAGDTVTITLVQTATVDPTFVAFGHLFSPTGAGPRAIGGGITNVPITETGTHTLRIFDLNNTARGTYSVRLYWLLPIAKQCGSRVSLVCFQLSDGAIDDPLEQEIFTFTAEAGDTVTVTFVQRAALDPTFIAFGHLFGPTGGAPRAIGGGITNVPITQTGTHTLRIFDLNNTARGTYTVRLSWLLPIGKQCTPPTMTLDKTSLRFGAVTTGASFPFQTAAQVVRLTQNGGGTVTWTAASNQPWLQVSPAAGTGSGNLTISVVHVGGLPTSGTLAGAITLSFTGAGNSPGPINVSLTLVLNGTSANPVGIVDTPTDNRTGVTGAVPFTGWALDDIEVTRVMICRAAVGAESAPVDPNCGGAAQIFLGFAVFIDGARPDVAGTFPTLPLNTRGGWGFMVLTNTLPNQGNGTFQFFIWGQDREGHNVVLGTRMMTCANATATLPFGAIDTPTQGGLASGSFAVFGWVLSRVARADPPGGGTVTVLVDGVAVGSPGGWAARPDLTAIFPGFPGISTALGVFGLDTTALTNGLHTIVWLVTDNAGASEGIGSRFFTVSNGAGGLTEAAGASLRVGRETRPGASLPAEVEALPLETSPLVVRRGWNLDGPSRAFEANQSGRTVIRSEELNRVELWLGDAPGARYTGHLRAGGALEPLPIGSKLDAESSAFTWAPGVGFVGAYDLVFVRWERGHPAARREVRIVLNPKGSGAVGPQVVIDIPRSQSAVSQPFIVGGWAADLSAPRGTGIATLHAWAYPATGGAPIFLGATFYGGARPDVAAVQGDRFRDSGFGLIVQSLPPGAYDLAVFAWSTEAADFLPARVVRIAVR